MTFLQLPKGRTFGLDFVRATAILFVVLSHGNYLLPERAAQIISFINIDGVTLFFVLSGFLIGRILIRSFDKEIDFSALRSFWIRRWFRTLPNYFLILTFLIVLHLIFSEDFKISWTLSYATFTQNMWYPHPWFFPEAWSLSIEEWFYLTVPLALFLLIKSKMLDPKLCFVTVAILIIVGSPLIRYLRYLSLEENSLIWDDHFRKQVITRLDSIMFGFVGAIIFMYYRKFWDQHAKPLLLLGCLGLIATNFIIIRPNHTGLYGYVFSFSIIPFFTLLTFPFFSNYQKSEGAFYKIITTISLISYSLYLVHLTLVQGFIVKFSPLIPGESSLIITIRYAFYWLSSLILSYLIYAFFERPTTKLRDRYS